MTVSKMPVPGEDACFRAALTKKGLVVRAGQVTQVPFVTLVTEYLILILFFAVSLLVEICQVLTLLSFYEFYVFSCLLIIVLSYNKEKLTPSYVPC